MNDTAPATRVPNASQSDQLIGQPIDRTDGRLKITGTATYSADVTLPRMAYAVMVLSTIASGRIKRIDAGVAQRQAGVLAVLTHENIVKLPQAGKAAVNPPAGRVLALLQDETIYYNQQPLAVIVADSLEQARDAARVLHIEYQAAPAHLNFADAKRDAHSPGVILGTPADSQRGQIEPSLSTAQHILAQTYTTPLQHHNPMEPHATVAEWSGDQLTLYDSTQYVSGVKNAVAKTLGIAPEQVRVKCPYVGGGFGGKGSTWSHVVLAALAARQVGRPVKLVLDRPQLFGPVGGRPNTEQALQLGSDAQGQLTALTHDVTSYTSMIEDWTEPAALVTRMLYACPNLRTSHRLAKLHLGTPTFQRAPGEATGTFALECALDELAYATQLDPLELRLRNYAQTDPEKDLPFSSKALRECYRLGAQRFGWSRRNAQAGVTRDGQWQVGMGMATATYPMRRSEAHARVRLLADGSALVQSGSQDLGTGTYTVMTQVAAQTLGLPLNKVRFELGDSALPPAPVSGGSQSVASVGPAVQAAALSVRDKLITLAVNERDSLWQGANKADLFISDGWLIMRGDARRREPIAALLARHEGQVIEADAVAQPGAEKQQYSMHAFGAVFAEVQVDSDLGVIRVPRIVGAYGVGNVLNAKTAHSQLMGGIIWGISMALLEESLLDARHGRIVNNNLAEYHVPVNADVHDIDIVIVPEQDQIVNSLGAKGIGEIGITGVAGAIANAIYHATGKRIRELPITLDKLL